MKRDDHHNQAHIPVLGRGSQASGSPKRTQAKPDTTAFENSQKSFEPPGGHHSSLSLGATTFYKS